MCFSQVCQAICEYVKTDKDFTPETKDDWKKVAQGFEERWQLPHCAGKCLACFYAYLSFHPFKKLAGNLAFGRFSRS